jgi:hypothetical protein
MEMEDGAQKTRKSTSSSFFLLAFLKIQSVEYFGKENTPTGFQLVLVSYSFSGPFLQLGTAMRV